MKKITMLLLLIVTFNFPSAIKGEDNFDDFFKEAEVSYSWFSGFCIHSTIGTLDFENPPLVLSGAKYYKIINGITSMEELRSHLLSLFSPEIVQNLLSSDINGNKYFIEKDGDLYYTLDAIGLNDYTIGERKLTIKEESDASIICELEYKIGDGEEIYKTEYIEYLIEKNDSDNFVFANFTLPASKWTFYEPNTQTNDITNLIGLIIISALVAVVFRSHNKVIKCC